MAEKKSAGQGSRQKTGHSRKLDQKDGWTKELGLTALGRKLILGLVLVIVIWPLGLGLVWTVDKCYTLVDRTKFLHLEKGFQDMLKGVAVDASPKQKGALLSDVLTFRLQQEMDSAFGWSVNDLWISPTSWFDNRANRQEGVLFATRMLTNFFSTKLAKYGGAGLENAHLKKAREQYFAFSPDSWWFPATEKQYERGIDEVRDYRNELLEGKAVFNVRSDDLYDLFKFVTGPDYLDQVLGLLLEDDREVKWNEIDDRVYYSQGVILVLRDFITAMVELYPEIRERGGVENIKIALRTMDEVASFDPLVVLRGHHDSVFADHRGKMARYLITIRERLNDVAQSLSR